MRAAVNAREHNFILFDKINIFQANATQLIRSGREWASVTLTREADEEEVLLTQHNRMYIFTERRRLNPLYTVYG